MAVATNTPMIVSEDFDKRLDNLFMTFHYEGDEITSFGYVITAKVFWTFVGSNNVGHLREEEVKFPVAFMAGTTRRALVHYVDDKKYSAFVPVFPTEDETKAYNEAFNKRRNS